MVFLNKCNNPLMVRCSKESHLLYEVIADLF